MTTEEFKELLSGFEIYWESQNIEGNEKIIVGGRDKFSTNVDLGTSKSIPPNVEFLNNGWINLDRLESLSSGIIFRNMGYVTLESLKDLPSDTVFENGTLVYLESLETLPFNFTFNNRSGVNLNSIKKIPSGVQFGNQVNHVVFNKFSLFLKDFDFGIEGISDIKILNKMISLGLFE